MIYSLPAMTHRTAHSTSAPHCSGAQQKRKQNDTYWGVPLAQTSNRGKTKLHYLEIHRKVVKLYKKSKDMGVTEIRTVG